MNAAFLSHSHTCGLTILHTSQNFKSPKRERKTGSSMMATVQVRLFYPRRGGGWEHESVRFVLPWNEIAPGEGNTVYSILPSERQVNGTIARTFAVLHHRLEEIHSHDAMNPNLRISIYKVLRHKSTLIMTNLRGTTGPENQGNNVKTQRAVFDLVGGEEVSGGPDQTLSLGRRDRIFGGPEGFIRPRADLDEDDRPVGVHHDQVQLARPAGVVAGQRSEALFLEESFAASLAPAA